jgi:hypothetical protein
MLLTNMCIVLGVFVVLLCVFVVSYVYLLYFLCVFVVLLMCICCTLMCICCVLCVFVVLLMCICCTLCVFVVLLMCICCTSYVYLLYYVCIVVLTLDAGLLARSQYPEVPATGHFDTGFSWFPCVYKRMLRWFPSFQVATTCLSYSPPELNFLVTFFKLYLCTCKITTATGW